MLTHKKEIRSYRATALTSVVLMWCASYCCRTKEREPEGWMQLHAGGAGGIGDQQFKVMITRLLQKQWSGQGGRRTKRLAMEGGQTRDVHRQHGYEEGL